jgi:hypothetical protein
MAGLAEGAVQLTSALAADGTTVIFVGGKGIAVEEDIAIRLSLLVAAPSPIPLTATIVNAYIVFARSPGT